eukprot:1160714-Pelagomonas_calceolata.AAC.21
MPPQAAPARGGVSNFIYPRAQARAACISAHLDQGQLQPHVVVHQRSLGPENGRHTLILGCQRLCHGPQVICPAEGVGDEGHSLCCQPLRDGRARGAGENAEGAQRAVLQRGAHLRKRGQ